MHHSPYFCQAYHDSSTSFSKQKRMGEDEGQSLLAKEGEEALAVLEGIAKRSNVLFQGWVLRFNACSAYTWFEFVSSAVC